MMQWRGKEVKEKKGKKEGRGRKRKCLELGRERNKRKES